MLRQSIEIGGPYSGGFELSQISVALGGIFDEKTSSTAGDIRELFEAELYTGGLDEVEEDLSKYLSGPDNEDNNIFGGLVCTQCTEDNDDSNLYNPLNSKDYGGNESDNPAMGYMDDGGHRETNDDLFDGGHYTLDIPNYTAEAASNALSMATYDDLFDGGHYTLDIPNYTAEAASDALSMATYDDLFDGGHYTLDIPNYTAEAASDALSMATYDDLFDGGHYTLDIPNYTAEAAGDALSMATYDNLFDGGDYMVAADENVAKRSYDDLFDGGHYTLDIPNYTAESAGDALDMAISHNTEIDIFGGLVDLKNLKNKKKNKLLGGIVDL
jgi:hypothetical protein